MRTSNGKLWATLHDGEFEVIGVTGEDLEEALDVLDASFYINESVCIACEIHLPQNAQARAELRELCKLTAFDGISLCVRHVPSRKIVAVSFNKIQYLTHTNEEQFFYKFRNERAKSPQAKSLMDFMIGVDSQIDVCAMFNMSCYCELMFLATLPTFEGRGFGRALAKYTIELSQQLSQGLNLEDVSPELREKRPAAVTALWTSAFSQKVGKATGFQVLNTVPFTEFEYNGKLYSESVNPLHKFCEHVAYVFPKS